MLAGLLAFVIGAILTGPSGALGAALLIGGSLLFWVGAIRAITGKPKPGEGARDVNKRFGRNMAIGCAIFLAIGLIAFGLCIAALNN
jgi:hypothetical protein